MATSEQVKFLIRSYCGKNHDDFVRAVHQIRAHAQTKNQINLVRDYDTLLVKLAHMGGEPRLTIVLPKGMTEGEFSELFLCIDTSRAPDPILSPSVDASLCGWVSEQDRSELLKSVGLDPTRKVLFSGPPGTGKTLSASYVAKRLGLPLFLVRLEGLISQFLGVTASRLNKVFEAISLNRAVYFFDEIDALGADRGNLKDVGEMHCALNSFLQFLDRDCSDSLIVGATNYETLLDRALFRRFDSLISFPLPTLQESERLFASLPLVPSSALPLACVPVELQLSHSDILSTLKAVARRKLLSPDPDSFEFEPALISAFGARTHQRS
jgi:hypothetical protein